VFTHDVIYLKDDSKNVSVINHLRDFSFMILNKLMVLIVLIISLCVSSAISRSYFKKKNSYINRDYLVLKRVFKEIIQIFINSVTRVLYVFIVITHIILELIFSCLIKRFKSVNFSLMTSAFIFLS